MHGVIRIVEDYLNVGDVKCSLHHTLWRKWGASVRILARLHTAPQHLHLPSLISVIFSSNDKTRRLQN